MIVMSVMMLVASAKAENPKEIPPVRESIFRMRSALIDMTMKANSATVAIAKNFRR
jgi:hypothetical protein